MPDNTQCWNIVGSRDSSTRPHLPRLCYPSTFYFPSVRINLLAPQKRGTKGSNTGGPTVFCLHSQISATIFFDKNNNVIPLISWLDDKTKLHNVCTCNWLIIVEGTIQARKKLLYWKGCEPSQGQVVSTGTTCIIWTLAQYLRHVLAD